MQTDYLDGRRETLRGLSDELLAAELARKAGEVEQIARITVEREHPTNKPLVDPTANRHERRREAALARRRGGRQR